MVDSIWLRHLVNVNKSGDATGIGEHSRHFQAEWHFGFNVITGSVYRSGDPRYNHVQLIVWKRCCRRTF